MPLSPHFMIIGRTMVASGFLAHCANIAFGSSVAAMVPDFTEARFFVGASLACFVGTFVMIGAALIERKE